MASQKDGGSGGRGKRVVRPRWVWIGIGLGILGAVVIGFGVAVSSWPLAIVGIVLLLVGAGIGWRGGALYDATGVFELDQEMHDVKEGNTREGTKPGDQVRDPDAHRESRRADRTRQATTGGTLRARRPGLSMLGAILLLVGAAFVLATHGTYPHSHTGQLNAERDLGMAVVVGWVGLLVLLSPRRHPVGAALALLCAVGMVLQAWLAPHDETTTVGFEIAVAVAYVLGGLMALDVRRPRAGAPASALERRSGAVVR
jgi:hypothetical protein